MECCRDVCCLCILVGREESIGMKYKGITIAHWDNHLQNEFPKSDAVSYCLV